MTAIQQKYIEKNIDLIENNDWEKFFESPPAGIGGVLYGAGIDFMTELGYVPGWAFRASKVKTVVIPDGVRNIGYGAFYSCEHLTRVIIPQSVTSINTEAFNNCKSLTQMIIPIGVTVVGDYAFSWCSSLTSVTIPNTITAIGEGVFLHCGKIEINYDGTVDAWKKLIGNNSRVFKYTTYVCTCTDGIVKKST